ncbi:MAG: cell division protein ZapA [Ignavibacteriae bacterium]|nr:cell division protein ZapA [Ignavibacteriota bacterium]
MAQRLRVFVGGNAYPLKGDNEKLIQLAAEEVNSQLEQLGRKHTGETEVRLSVLAALNIAEKQLKLQQQHEIDRKYVVKEIENITDMIMVNLSNRVGRQVFNKSCW